MDRFIPVKVTDGIWADKLLAGEVFMRPLYEFGMWSALDKLIIHTVAIMPKEPVECFQKRRIAQL